MRGAGTRLLLADAVGQGKTIEAGILLRELAARGAADRLLILTPLTVRDQWRSELAVRCRLDAEVIDRASLRARERRTLAGLSPFQAPGVVLMSTDLAKQPDILARLVHVCWDVLIIDEAHGVSGDSARAAAAEALGARARLVVLLTATPHAGDTTAFGRLCAIGRFDGDPPPLWFRHRPRRIGVHDWPKRCDISRPDPSTSERALPHWGRACTATRAGQVPRGALNRPGPSQTLAVESGRAGSQPAASDGLARSTRCAHRSTLPAV